MKTKIIRNSLITVGIMAVYAILNICGGGCSDDKIVESAKEYPELQTSFLGHSDCLLPSSPVKNQAYIEWACLEYTYDGRGTLKLTHLEAPFNCCLDSLTAVISNLTDGVSIHETSYLNGDGCDCFCPYNLNYQIEQVTPRTFKVQIYMNEPTYFVYPLEFDLDLSLQPVTDTMCIEIELDFEQ